MCNMNIAHCPLSPLGIPNKRTSASSFAAHRSRGARIQAQKDSRTVHEGYLGHLRGRKASGSLEKLNKLGKDRQGTKLV